MDYIISQILTVIAFALLGMTYVVKDRRKLLFFSLMASAVFIVSYFFLKAWSGLAMSVISLVRCGLFLIENKKCEDRQMTKFGWFVLGISIVALIICAIFTYEGFLSLFSVFGELIYTISIWQKNIKAYTIIGIGSTVLWTAYNIVIGSIVGIVLQVFLLIIEIVGLLKTQQPAILKEKE